MPTYEERRSLRSPLEPRYYEVPEPQYDPVAPVDNTAASAPAAYRPDYTPDEISQEAKALKTGAYGLMATGNAGLAAGGAALGFESFANERLAAADEYRKEAAASAPDIMRLEDAESPSDYLRLATNQVLMNLPLMATMGGAAGLGFKLAGKAGGWAGAAASYEVPSAGENFLDFMDDPNATGTMQEKGQLAHLTGAGQAALGMAPIMGVLNRMGIGKAAKAQVLKSFKRKVAEVAATGAIGEGVTETGEEALKTLAHQSLNENIKFSDPEVVSNLLNAAFAGFSVGGFFGGAGGVASGIAEAPKRAAAKLLSQEDYAPTGDQNLDDFHAQMRDISAADSVAQFDTDDKRLGEIQRLLAEGNTEDDAIQLRHLVAALEPGSEAQQVASQLYNEFVGADTSLDETTDSAAVAQEQEQLDLQQEVRDAAELSDETTGGEADALQFNDGLETVESRPRFLNDTYVSAGAAQRLGYKDAVGAKNRVAKESKRDKSGQFEEVPLVEKLIDDAQRQGKDKDTVLREAYDQMLTDKVSSNTGESAASWKAIADEAGGDPIKFLSNFTVVRRTEVANAALPAEPIELTRDDIEYKDKQTQLLSDKKRVNPKIGNREFEATVDGEKRFVDAPTLVRMMMDRVDTAGTSDRLTNQRIAKLFFTGVSSLASAKGMEVSPGQISDDLVVYKDGNREVRFGQLRQYGRSLEMSVQGQKAEIVKIDARIDAGKAALKAEKIPAKQKAITDALNRLQARKAELKQRAVSGNERVAERKLAERAGVEGLTQEQIANVKREQKAAGLKMTDTGGAIDGVEDTGTRRYGEGHSVADTGEAVPALMGEFADNPAYSYNRERDGGVEARRHPKEKLDDEFVNRVPKPEAKKGVEGGDAPRRTAVERKVEPSKAKPLDAKQENALHKLREKNRAAREQYAKENPQLAEAVKKETEFLDDPYISEGNKVKYAEGLENHYYRPLKELLQKGDPAAHRATTEQVKEWTAKLNLRSKVDVMSLQEAITYLTDNKLFHRLAQIETLRLHGFTVVDKGVIRVFVHPALRGRVRNEILAHEMGHAVFKSEAFSTTEAQARRVFDEFVRWKNGLTGDMTVGKLLGEKKTAKALMLTAMDDLHGQQLKDLPQRSQEYLTDFEEWFADKVSHYLTVETKSRSVFSRIAEALRKLFGLLSRRPGTVEEYLDYLRKGTVQITNRVNVWERLRQQDVFAAETPNGPRQRKTGASKILQSVHSRLKGLDQEQLNGVAWAAYLAKEITPGINPALMYAFSTILRPAEMKALARAAQGAVVQRQLRSILGERKELHDPLHAAAYMYQLWHLGKLTVGPQSRGVFEAVKEVLAKVLGYVLQHEQANVVLENLRNGRAELREQGRADWELQTVINDTLLQKLARGVDKGWENYGGWIRALGYPATSRVYRTKNPALIWIAQQFQPKVGEADSPEALFDARQRMFGRFDNIVTDIIFKGKDAAFGQATLDVLQNPDKFAGADPDVQKAVSMTRTQFFGKLRTYMTKSGIEVGDRGHDYFPWVFDVDYLQAHNDEFMDLLRLPKYAANMQALAKSWTERDVAKFKTMNKRAPSDQELADLTYDVADMPQRVLEQLIDTRGAADIQPMHAGKIGHIPSNRFINTRELAFLHDDIDTLQPFMQKDLGLILRTYLEQAVKRTEYVRRFGPSGEKLEEKIAEAEQHYKASGEDLVMIRNYVDAMLGTLGYRTNARLMESMGLQAPPQGEVINPKLRDAMGGVMVFQNFRLLGLATLSSLIDPVGVLVRTGDVGMAWAGLRQGVQTAVAQAKGKKTELSVLAEMIGAVDLHMTNEALGYTYGGLYLTGTSKKINEGLFKWNGLQAWTRWTRVMALASGQKFLARHAANPNKHSERFLSELNLTKQDVLLDNNGELRILTHKERMAASQEERDRDARVRAALNRFVNEAILRPNAAQRPIWASDPHFMLFWHLKSFTYAFHDVILRRVAHEIKNDNVVPLLYLTMFVPVMIAADLLRDLIQYGAGGNPRKAGWDSLDYMSYGAERSGVLGLGIIPIDAARDVEFGGIFGESFAGPTAELLLDAGRGHLEMGDLMPLQNVIK